MRHTIVYEHIDDEYEDIDVSMDMVELSVDEDIKDIEEFEFKQKYHKDFNPLCWYLEDGAKEMFDDLEDKYFHNTLDMFKYYTTNYDFIDFIKEKYYNKALKIAYKQTLGKMSREVDVD